MTITAALFTKAGETLFGEDWRQPLADLLGMNIRTVRRIGAAARDGMEYPVNESLGPILAAYLKERARTAVAQAQEAERLAKLLE